MIGETPMLDSLHDLAVQAERRREVSMTFAIPIDTTTDTLARLGIPGATSTRIDSRIVQSLSVEPGSDPFDPGDDKDDSTAIYRNAVSQKT